MKEKGTTLTREERDIIILTALQPDGKHLSNSEIAQRLGVSVSRVKTLIHQACVKLGVHKSSEAIISSIMEGKIRINEFYSLDELAEILSSLSPDFLIRIAHLLRQELELGYPPGKDGQIIPTNITPYNILTKRERDVLILVGHQLTNKEIADRLCISVGAVNTFLYRACTKLGAHKREDALLLAVKRREIGVGEIYSFNELLQILAPLGAETIEKIAQLLGQKLGQEPIPTGS